jgi:hypothetical protein
VTKHLQMIALVFVFALASSAIVRTQEKPAAPAAAKPVVAQSVFIPLRVQVIVSRYQGEKKLSSLPYTLSVTAGHNANLRMGAKVPVMMITAAKLPEGVPQVGPIQYQDVGTNIDCSVSPVQDDGRYQVVITLDDSSVYGEAPGGATANAPPPGNPSFRSFRASDSMMLRDGQTAQFTTATDKVSGEIVKVDVTLTVVK